MYGFPAQPGVISGIISVVELVLVLNLYLSTDVHVLVLVHNMT